jgi:Protein of unknown function (DUF3096)
VAPIESKTLQLLHRVEPPAAGMAIAATQSGLHPLSIKGVAMNVTLSLGPLISLIAGILILIVPSLLNYIVALYLIIIGVVGLFGVGGLHL